MEDTQLPLSCLNGVPVEGVPNFEVVSGNSMEIAISAANMARVTGSIGMSEFHRHTIYPPDFKDNGIREFAIVKRINI